MSRPDDDRAFRILGEAKKYRQLTGKPMGITGEVAEYEASRLLGIRLTSARQPGYDAVDEWSGTLRRLQIKGRCLPANAGAAQRLGSIRLAHDWDAVLMVLLDEALEAVEIWEADRPAIVDALTAPGSKARNERGALDVRKFESIGRLRWRRPPGDPSNRESTTQPDAATAGGGGTIIGDVG
jgi:hypothetical protein